MRSAAQRTTRRRADALRLRSYPEQPIYTLRYALLSPNTMSQPLSPISFDQPDLAAALQACADARLDELDFGVIGFDSSGVVRIYNAFESKAAGLSRDRVIGQQLFTVVAPCMNNFMVAQRFEDAQAAGETLDAIIDYVLTLRMRPVKVQLRLLATPGLKLRYVLVQRNA